MKSPSDNATLLSSNSEILFKELPSPKMEETVLYTPHLPMLILCVRVMCVCVFMYVCMYAHMRVCTFASSIALHVKATGQRQVSPSVALHCNFLRQSLSWNRNSSIGLTGRRVSSRDAAISAAPGLGLQTSTCLETCIQVPCMLPY